MFCVAVYCVDFYKASKSCIDSPKARKFEKKFQNSVIDKSHNHDDEIAEILLNYFIFIT